MKFCDVCHTSYPNEFQTCPKDQAPLRSASELLQGMVIRDKYQVLEKIGAGGMAVVYKAKHLAFNEIRALKLVSSRMLEDQDFLKRFKTEAVVTRKLQHPNAVRVDDIDTTEDGRPFIVMEFVEGRNLRQVIAQEGPLAVNRALGIAKQVAQALAAAHRLGITHRDIKPDNILLVPQPDGSELVKVLDFGIAKVREGAFDTGAGYTATQTGMVVGTPQYISPEQAMGKHGQEVDGRADLYSLGVVLYEMITGQLPFDSDTPMGMLIQHIQTAPRPPHLLKPELNIPEPVSKLLMKALAKHPEDRFQSADEMYEALRHPREWIAASQAGTRDTIVMGSPDESAPTPAPATVRSPAPPSAARTTVASPRPAAAPPAAAAPRPAAARPAAPRRPAPQPIESGVPWARIAVVALLLEAVLAGGYFFFGHRSAAAHPRAARSEAPVATPAVPPAQPAATDAAPATQPAAEDAKPAESSAAASQPEAEPQPQETSQARQARELIARGRIALDNGNYQIAIANFREALRLDPGNPAAQAGLQRAQRARRAEAEVLGRRR